MFEPRCLMPGKEIENVKGDFRAAKRIEQYRIGKTALYMPEGFLWNYIPVSEIRGVEESYRVLPGGHCNPIRAKRPELDIITESKTYPLPLDREESVGKFISTLKESKANESFSE